MQVTPMDRRVGDLLGFGAKYRFINAFDGIRYLCKRIKSIHEEFAHVFYPVMVMVERLVQI
jgi:hypothetical protein